MAQNLYLFIDTNLFIQCRDLRELDWSEWKDFPEVHLIVCLPVQREIDKQKTRGKNDRVGRRARNTYSSLFRPIATGEKKYELIREADPQVRLFLESPSQPDPELSDRLDYNNPDDEIIGCLHRYTKDNPNADARLLTYDTGPMMTARGIGLSIAPIKQEWLLPPEDNEAEREIAQLNREIAQLKKTEPQFNIRCVDNEGAEVDSLEYVHKVYEPLNEQEILEYIDTLKDRFPIATEFNQQEPKPMGSTAASLGQRWRFKSVSEDAINNYKDHEYPEWIEDCRKVLSNIHKALQRKEGQPAFRFEVGNEGTRPGNDALVVIRAEGHFKICPPLFEEEDSEDGRQVEPSIPSPPTPPRGRWRASRTRLTPEGADSFVVPLGSNRPSASYTPIREPRHDPNAFYYKPKRIQEPADTFSLECEQWRHGTGGESFDGNIFLKKGMTTASGVLECEIHAENLFKPTIKRIPVRIEVQYVSSRDFANNLVNPPLGPLDKLFRN